MQESVLKLILLYLLLARSGLMVFGISYEGLHMICSTCGCYGHLTRNCKAPPPQPPPPPPETTKEPEKSDEMLGTEGEREEPDDKQKGAFNAAPLTQDTGEIHGDWLVVTRRKRSPKVPPKNNSLAHLANSFEKLSIPSKAVTHVGSKRKGTDFYVPDYTPNFASSSDNKAKSAWRIKKRRHEEGPPLPIATTSPTKVKSSEPKHFNQKKETNKIMKDPVTILQSSEKNRLPLQESSKQNIIAPPFGSTPSMKGAKSAMEIIQVSPNHFKFTEENKPTDKVIEAMEITEENDLNTSSNTDVHMQDGKDMGSESSPSFHLPTKS